MGVVQKGLSVSSLCWLWGLVAAMAVSVRADYRVLIGWMLMVVLVNGSVGAWSVRVSSLLVVLVAVLLHLDSTVCRVGVAM